MASLSTYFLREVLCVGLAMVQHVFVGVISKGLTRWHLLKQLYSSE